MRRLRLDGELLFYEINNLNVINIFIF
jgi:hypothetical protein